MIVDARGTISVFGGAIGDDNAASNSSADAFVGDSACSRRAASFVGERIKFERFYRVDESAQGLDYRSRP